MGDASKFSNMISFSIYQVVRKTPYEETARAKLKEKNSVKI